MLKLPFKFRDVQEGTVPEGPDFRLAKEVTLDLGGTEINLRLPKHNPKNPGCNKSIYQEGKCDLYDVRLYQDYNEIGSWSGAGVLGRSFGFYGPILTGIIAELSVGLVIRKRKFTQSSETLFNANIFERELLDFLALTYSDEKTYYGASNWHAPCDWKPIDKFDKFDIFAIQYDIKRVIGVGNYYTQLAFPIADDCMVIVYFNYQRFLGGGLEELDRFIDRKPMVDLANNIIDSLQVSFSPQAMKQYKRAKAENPDAKLSESMERLKWTTPEDDAKYADYLKNPQNYHF